MKCSLGISNFLEEISSSSYSCFPVFLCFDHRGRISYLSLLFFGTLHSNGYIFPFLLCLSLLFFSAICKAPQTSVFHFCTSFSWGWCWSLPPVQCHEPLSIILQVLCLSDVIPWIYLSLPPHNRKGFHSDHTWMVEINIMWSLRMEKYSLHLMWQIRKSLWEVDYVLRVLWNK